MALNKSNTYPAGLMFQTVPCWVDPRQSEQRKSDGKKPVTHEVKVFTGKWKLLGVRQVTSKEVRMMLASEEHTTTSFESWFPAVTLKGYAEQAIAEHGGK